MDVKLATFVSVFRKSMHCDHNNKYVNMLVSAQVYLFILIVPLSDKSFIITFTNKDLGINSTVTLVIKASL